jgi:hypothetical protein
MRETYVRKLAEGLRESVTDLEVLRRDSGDPPPMGPAYAVSAARESAARSAANRWLKERIPEMPDWTFKRLGVNRPVPRGPPYDDLSPLRSALLQKLWPEADGGWIG